MVSDRLCPAVQNFGNVICVQQEKVRIGLGSWGAGAMRGWAPGGLGPRGSGDSLGRGKEHMDSCSDARCNVHLDGFMKIRPRVLADIVLFESTAQMRTRTRTRRRKRTRTRDLEYVDIADKYDSDVNPL